MTQPFVILSQPRTGSTLLCSLFNSHPEVRAVIEPINPTTHSHHMKPISGATYLFPEVMVQNNIGRVLDLLFSPKQLPAKWIENRRQGHAASGFKIMAHQLRGLKSEPDFWKYLVDHQIKVILCFRYDILSQYVSDLIAMITGQPTCWDGKVSTTKVKVNIGKLEAELKRIIDEKIYLINKVDELGLPKRRVKYEDFKSDVTVVEDLLFWLIGERYPLTTKLFKQNPDSLQAKVSNYNDLAVEATRLGLGRLLINHQIGD